MDNLFTLVKQEDDNKLLEDLYIAYYDTRKNKRNKKVSLEYELDFEKNIINLHKSIINKSYKPKSCIAFLVKRPVLREVFAASFEDRIIHHYIYNQISPIFEKEFIEDSYSCRKGKGTLFGINRVFDFIKECSCDYSKDCYILKLDIKGYFYSINKNILYEIIIKELVDKKRFLNCDFDTLIFLITKTIFSNPRKDVVVYKDKDWDILPKNKSLFYAKENCGLPIGNLTSQLFSNIYMNIFDRYVKDELKIKYYGRYVDDFVIVHQNKDFLKKSITIFRNFLENNLHLEIHPNKIYLQDYKKGLSFLGAFLKPNVKFPSKRIKANFNNLIYSINQNITFNEEYILNIRNQINSYLGILGHLKSYRLKEKSLSKLNSSFFETFYFDDNLVKVSIRKNYAKS